VYDKYLAGLEQPPIELFDTDLDWWNDRRFELMDASNYIFTHMRRRSFAARLKFYDSPPMFFDQWLKLASKLFPCSSPLDIAVLSFRDIPLCTDTFRDALVAAAGTLSDAPAVMAPYRHAEFAAFRRWYLSLPWGARNMLRARGHDMYWVGWDIFTDGYEAFLAGYPTGEP